MCIRDSSKDTFVPTSDASDEDNFEFPVYIRDFPPRENIAAGLNTLFDRNVRILALFTNGQRDIYNYKQQFVDSMPEVNFRKLFDTEFYRYCSHIISEPNQQTMVVERITGWVYQNENTMVSA